MANKESTKKMSMRSQRKPNQSVTTSTCRLKAAKRHRESVGDRSGSSDTLNKELQHHLSINIWYHGLMPREEIEHYLKSEGDFLLRKTEVNGQPRIAISVVSKNRIRHILLSTPGNQWCIRQLKKPSLNELVEYHMQHKVPVQGDGTLLITPIPRPNHIILHEHVTIEKKLGSGAFGDVYRGLLKLGEKPHEVAIKKFRGIMSKKDRVELIKEFNVMREFDHRNVVKVYGVAPQEEPMLLILELCAGGAVNAFLKGNPNTSKDQLVEFGKDACRGMCYLSARKIIHRDLAARNCLLDEKKVLKISDFGLSVSNQEELKVERLKNMPFRYLSPETLRTGSFTTKSDVWSYGILLWEIFSFCTSEPYAEETTVQKVKARVVSGTNPLSPPEGTPTIPATVMKLCFTTDPKERPEFTTLLKLLSPDEKPPQ
ncbi:Tyrosine-protein kinase [Aphelenchoides besseyi]|nr:Tyrosine-protein kinase [Aphelenchoides besseyi]KAI6194895.1 Tyrosine-protein kinase [Aphelenchoides besseyi]